MSAFTILADSDLRLVADEPLRSMYTLSPFVWRSRTGINVLLRAVNRDDDPSKKIARIFHGRSDDGLTFRMDVDPDIAPGPDVDDLHGCEDPSVADVEGVLYVYYSGWNQDRKIGKLMLACGSEACTLRKRGVALHSTGNFANPKEATIARRADGTWVLFFEYARRGRSRIGMALSEDVAGPWTIASDPFTFREGQWDGFHLSPGPVWERDDGVVMFYNGGTEQPVWRIGWVLFDRNYSEIRARAKEPLFIPPSPSGDDRDIAFASSLLTGQDGISLYYSLADRRMKRMLLAMR